jgi:hypothetical protein
MLKESEKEKASNSLLLYCFFVCRETFKAKKPKEVGIQLDCQENCNGWQQPNKNLYLLNEQQDLGLFENPNTLFMYVANQQVHVPKHWLNWFGTCKWGGLINLFFWLKLIHSLNKKVQHERAITSRCTGFMTRISFRLSLFQRRKKIGATPPWPCKSMLSPCIT